jgi:type I restriction-modification system DNA methylase subunit
VALKKTELYSSLWSSCDELRGGMDASQYKDYVLVLLFIKYISDKYAGQPFAPITIPEGASFKDMVALKGKSDIGDQICACVSRSARTFRERRWCQDIEAGRAFNATRTFDGPATDTTAGNGKSN